MARSARPPARRVRGKRGRAVAARRDTAPRHRLGRQSRDAHRGRGPRRRRARVRHAPARAADVSPTQGRGPKDCGHAGRHGLCGHHLLPAGSRCRRARPAARVNTRVLGRTGLKVSEIGFGGWAIGGNAFGNSYGPTDDAESTRAVRRAYDLGCTFFDTADVYGHGHSEEVLGAALQGIRDQVIVATKVGGNFYNRDIHPLMRDRIAQAVGRPLEEIARGVALAVTHDANFTAPYIRFAVERSLARLRTDYVDLLQLHNPPINLISTMETYEVLEQLKREGSIRFYGVSVHPPEEGIAAVNATMPDTVQIVYNLARREAEDAFFPAARTASVGVIVREPLANGFLAGKYAPDSTWELGDIRARTPRPYVAQLTARGQRVKELAEDAGPSAAQFA